MTKNTALVLGGEPECLEVEVDGKTYRIPLADYMPMADAKTMLQIKRMPAKERDGAYTEFFFSYFERYIGEEPFNKLTSKDFETMMDGWNKANDAEGSAETGE